MLGVHRSGTSAMTRVLGLSGGRMPTDPHPAGPDNEHGFWESKAVIALNEEILGAVDSSWDDIFAGQARRHLSNFDRVFRHKAAEVLDAAFDRADPIVLKDPRINVLAAFWDAALRAHDYEPVYIVMVRNPAEVAASMLARNDMPTEQGLLLWLDHMLAAERDTRNARRLFVAYEDLLEDWRTCLDRIERVWEQALPRRTSAAANAIEQYLSPNLRHQKATDAALQGRSPARRLAADAYGWFKGACQTTEPVDGGVLDGLRGRLAEARETFEPIVADQRVRLAEYMKHASGLEALREHLQNELAVTRSTADNLQQELARLRASTRERDQELDQLLMSANEREAALAIDIDGLHQELGSLRASARERDQELARLLASANEREMSLAAELEDSRLQLAQASSDAARSIQDMQALVEARDVEREARIKDLDRHREEIVRREETLDLLKAEVAVWRDADDVRERTLDDLRQTEADVEMLEARYGVASEELRRIQTVAEDALAQSRLLRAELMAQADDKAARERSAVKEETERRRLGFEIDELRERHAREANELQHRIADSDRQTQDARHEAEAAVAQLRDARTDTSAMQARWEELHSEKLQAEREIESLRAERAQILGSSSWKLTAIPRRLISGLKRN